MFTMTYGNVEELNAEVKTFRAEGYKVNVRKTEQGFEATFVEGAGCKATSTYTPKRNSNPNPFTPEGVWFYDTSDYKTAAADAKKWNDRGRSVHLFKASSGKCWVLKLL